MSKIKKCAIPSKIVSAGKPRHTRIQTKAYRNKSKRVEKVRQKGLPQACI